MRRFQPALLGGLFIGVLSSLPVVSACCCLWVIAGGFLTVYLQRQAAPSPGRNSAEAVLGGLVAGLVGAVISVAVQGLMTTVGGDALIAEMESAFDQFGQVPHEVRDRVISLVSSGGYLFVVAAVTLPVYAIFSVLGALLGVAVLPAPKAPTPPTTLET